MRRLRWATRAGFLLALAFPAQFGALAAQQVAFLMGPWTSTALAVANADGSDARVIAGGSTTAWNPAWSPDGRRLAVQASDPGPHTSHIWIVDVATGVAHRLAAHEQSYVDEIPTWFPDGRRLVFQSDRSGSMQIWVMSDEGTGPVQVTR